MCQDANWKISFDPLGLCNYDLNSVESLEDEAKLQGEDVLQLSKEDEVLDIGWYQTSFKVLHVKAGKWESPLSEKEFLRLSEALSAIGSDYNIRYLLQYSL